MAYQPVQSWELTRHHGPRKGTQAIMNIILFLYGWLGARNGGIYNRRRQRGGSAWSLHAVGRAGDIAVPNKAVGDAIVKVLIQLHVVLGICEIIWYRSRWTPELGWRSYSGQDDHTSHIHYGNTIAFADSKASLEALQQWVINWWKGAIGG